METLQPGRQRRRRRHRTLALAPPTRLQRTPLAARQQITLDRLQHCREAAVLLQPLQVLDAVATGKVQEYHRQHHLQVQPTLAAGDLDVLADRRRKPTAVNQVQIQRQTRQRGHPGAGTFGFVLEAQHTLW